MQKVGLSDIFVKMTKNAGGMRDDTIQTIAALPGVIDRESLIHLSTKLDRAIATA